MITLVHESTKGWTNYPEIYSIISIHFNNTLKMYFKWNFNPVSKTTLKLKTTETKEKWKKNNQRKKKEKMKLK